MKKSALFARSKSNGEAGPIGKKNGCCNPSGNRDKPPRGLTSMSPARFSSVWESRTQQSTEPGSGHRAGNGCDHDGAVANQREEWSGTSARERPAQAEDRAAERVTSAAALMRPTGRQLRCLWPDRHRRFSLLHNLNGQSYLDGLRSQTSPVVAGLKMQLAGNCGRAGIRAGRHFEACHNFEVPRKN